MCWRREQLVLAARSSLESAGISRRVRFLCTIMAGDSDKPEMVAFPQTD